MTQIDIPGYTYGTDTVPHSPVSLAELELLRATLLLGDDDRIPLHRIGRWISTLPGPSTTRPGSTTSTKSAYATPAGARTALTASKPPITYPCVTSSPYWFRLRRP